MEQDTTAQLPASLGTVGHTPQQRSEQLLTLTITSSIITIKCFHKAFILFH